MDFTKEDIQNLRLDFIKAVADAIKDVGCLNIDSVDTEFDNDPSSHDDYGVIEKIADCFRPDLKKVVLTIRLSEFTET